MTGAPLIAVIMPAWNAAATIGESLASVATQTLEEWELIVVDDGSADDTVAIARAFAASEPRCRVLTQPNAGVGMARNLGVTAAAAPWIVFLDSDDWLLPNALEAFVAGSEADPLADAVVGAWGRVTRDGTVTPVHDSFSLDEIFDVTARYCPFAIHAVAVRREAFQRAGGFDPAFRTGADWDFWQRLARLGVRFSRTDVEVARYRTLPNSMVMQPWNMITTGFRIIDRGHAADPRLPGADPRFARGRDPGGRSAARIAFATWPAAMLLGTGESADRINALLANDVDSAVDPAAITRSLYTAALLPTSSPAEAWIELYPRIAGQIATFVRALEASCGTPGLAGQVVSALERTVVLEAAARHDRARAGATMAIRVEVTEPIVDVDTGTGCERVHCRLTLDGEPLGTRELSVSGGSVPAAAIADAIVADHGWRILGAFFAATIYPSLHVSAVRRLGIRRWLVAVGPWVPPGTPRTSPAFHDAVGWCVFLQELWGKPYWPHSWFYRGAASSLVVDDVPFALDGLPRFEVSTSDAWSPGPGRVAVCVGGMPLFGMQLPRRRAQGIAAITAQGGHKLCQAAVREGLLGQPLRGGLSLRARLVAAAQRQAAREHRDRRLASAS